MAKSTPRFRSRLGDFQPPRHRDEDIALVQPKLSALLADGQEGKGQPVWVEGLSTAAREWGRRYGVTSAWASMRIGRVPSIIGMTTVPVVPLVRSSMKSCDGFLTSFSPPPSIWKTAISSVGPNRFLIDRTRRMFCSRLSFEVEHGVDEVLEHPRSCDPAWT